MTSKKKAAKSKKKICYIIKLKNGYLEYTERVSKDKTEYGTTTSVADAKVFVCSEDRVMQRQRLKIIAKNVNYMPEVVEYK